MCAGISATGSKISGAAWRVEWALCARARYRRIPNRESRAGGRPAILDGRGCRDGMGYDATSTVYLLARLTLSGASMRVEWSMACMMIASRRRVVSLMRPLCYINNHATGDSAHKQLASGSSKSSLTVSVCARVLSSRLTEEEREYSFGWLIKVVTQLVKKRSLLFFFAQGCTLSLPLLAYLDASACHGVPTLVTLPFL